jgi:hypothetical protein
MKTARGTQNAVEQVQVQEQGISYIGWVGDIRVTLYMRNVCEPASKTDADPKKYYDSQFLLMISRIREDWRRWSSSVLSRETHPCEFVGAGHVSYRRVMFSINH